MAITSSLGVGSGLDLASLLDGLKSAEQQRLAPLRTQASSYNTKLSAYGTLQSTLTNFKSSVEKLGESDLFRGVKMNSESEAFKASAATDADTGSYNIEVTQLARAQSLVTAGEPSTEAAIGNGGTITLSLGNAAGEVSETVDIDISAENSSLDGIRDAINAADIGVNASIVNDGSDKPYRLVLSSQATGTASQITVAVTENNGDTSTPLGDLLNYDGVVASSNMTETVAARDAQLSVNGIAITSQNNTVENAIQGVTLTLTGTTTEPQSLSATRDTEAVKSALQSFVSGYNRVRTISDKLTAFNGEDSASGVLLGDSTARTVQTRVRSALNTPVEAGAFSSLAQIGITLQRDGSMEIDEEKLDAALASNLSDIEQLMVGNGEARGLSTMLTGVVDEVAGEKGLLQNASDGMKSRIESLSERMERAQDSIDATIDRYRQQFVQLDTMMATLNSTQNYLSQQFEALSAQTKQ